MIMSMKMMAMMTMMMMAMTMLMMVMMTLSREDYQVEESKAGDRVGARPMIRSP